MEGSVYLPRLNGPRVSVHESHAARLTGGEVMGGCGWVGVGLKPHWLMHVHVAISRSAGG